MFYAVDINPRFDGSSVASLVVSDDQAIKAWLIHLLTSFDESCYRIFDFNPTESLAVYLQEPADNTTTHRIRSSLLRIISTREPRIILDSGSTKVVLNSDKTYMITIAGTIRANAQVFSSSFLLKG